MKTPVFCRDCKWAKKIDSQYGLRCSNPKVNAQDAWSLSSTALFAGVECRSARDSKWFAACGMKGKLFELTKNK